MKVSLQKDGLRFNYGDSDECYLTNSWFAEFICKSAACSEITIQTTTGRTVHLFDPKPEEISLKDIALALSRINRFTGHTRRRYSVAEHSIYVAQLLKHWGEPAYVQLQGLLHDAQEAYLGDISGPLKSTPIFGDIFRLAEERMLKCIYEGLAAPTPWPLEHELEVIKCADRMMLDIEIPVIRDGSIGRTTAMLQADAKSPGAGISEHVMDMLTAKIEWADRESAFISHFVDLHNEVKGL